MTSRSFFSPVNTSKQNDLFTLINDKEKQQIRTFKKLEKITETMNQLSKKHQLLLCSSMCMQKWIWTAIISTIYDWFYFMSRLLVWCIFFCNTLSQTVGNGLKRVLHVFLLAQTKDAFYRSCIAAHTGLLKQTHTTPRHCQPDWMQIGWSRWLDL